MLRYFSFFSLVFIYNVDIISCNSLLELILLLLIRLLTVEILLDVKWILLVSLRSALIMNSDDTVVLLMLMMNYFHRIIIINLDFCMMDRLMWLGCKLIFYFIMFFVMQLLTIVMNIMLHARWFLCYLNCIHFHDDFVEDVWCDGWSDWCRWCLCC